MTERVDTPAGARRLADRILAAREKPLVVVSTVAYAGGLAVDLVTLERELAGHADIAVLVTGDVSRAFEEALPPKLHVFGGAGRSYPVDIGEDPDIRRSPLRFPGRTQTDTADLLIRDALGQSYTGTTVVNPTVATVASAGTVKGVVAGRGIVALDSGGLASIVHELTLPSIPLEWTVQPGQRVDGILTPTSGHFRVSIRRHTELDAARRFPDRAVTVALVRDVDESRAVLALHPTLEISVSARDISPNERDRPDLLLSTGDVVTARVVHTSGGVTLRLDDIDDDEALVAAWPVLAGGAPWLRLDRPLRGAEDDDPELIEGDPGGSLHPATTLDGEAAPDLVDSTQGGDVVEVSAAGTTAAPDLPTRPLPGPGLRMASPPAPTPAPHRSAEPSSAGAAAGVAAAGPALRSTQLALEAAQARIRDLTRPRASALDEATIRLRDDLRREQDITATLRLDLGDQNRANAALRRQISDVQRALRERTRQRARAETPAPTRSDRRELWSSDEEWIRHEIYLAWVSRVSAGDRATHPLPEVYGISARFIASLDDLDEAGFDKATKAVVDVLTGLVRDVAGREMHPLRTSEAGNAPAHRRASDGATCYRVYIEQKVPAARRLHFWRTNSGGIDLERIVTHDVTVP